MLTKEPPHYLWAEALGDHPLVEKPVTDPPRQGHLLQPTRSHLTAGRCRGVFRTRQGPSLQGEWGQSGRWRDPSENQLPAPEGTPAGLGVTGRAPPLTAGFLVCRRTASVGSPKGHGSWGSELLPEQRRLGTAPEPPPNSQTMHLFKPPPSA